MSQLRRLFLSNPLHELTHRPEGQIPALDALRTCAVLMVLVGHVCQDYGKMFARDNWVANLRLLTAGWMGVDLFFVLSGYFIGRQLWRELAQTGTIRFGRFVLRRGFRIWPLYFFFLLLVLVVVDREPFERGRGWSDVLFLTNYFIDQGAVKGSWSLCTEEQFYTATPLLLILGAPWIGSVRGFRKYLLTLLILCPVIRALSWWFLTHSLARHDPHLFVVTLYQPIHTHADGLIMGLLLANLELTDGDRFKQGFLGSTWSVLVALVAAAALRSIQCEVFNFTAIAVLFGAVVWFLLARRRRWLSWLEAIPFYWLSRLSFGMYLNHSYLIQPALRFGQVSVPLADRYPALHNIAMIGLVTLLSAGGALVTFCFIEHPFLRVREVLLDRSRGEHGSDSTAVATPQTRTAPGLWTVVFASGNARRFCERPSVPRDNSSLESTTI